MSVLDKELSFGKKSGGKGSKASPSKVVLPTKTSINLVQDEVGSTNRMFQIIAFVAALILICIFAKFLVVDPLASASQSGAELAAAEQQLSELQAENKDYNELQAKYDSYVISGLTNEEQALADRNSVLSLIKTRLMHIGNLRSVQVSSNNLVAVVENAKMERVSKAVKVLKANPLVLHVTVQTAQGTDESQETTASTSATIQITLQDVVEVEEDTDAIVAGDPNAVAEAALGVDL